MTEDTMADDTETAVTHVTPDNRPRGHKHPNSNFGRAQRRVEDLRRRHASLKETVAKGVEAQEQLPDVRKELDIAEARLAVESREVAITNVPALKLELQSITARMDNMYSTEAERRIHEILSAARACGASGQSYEQFKLATTRIKSGTSAWRWTMFVDWIREPAEAA